MKRKCDESATKSGLRASTQKIRLLGRRIDRRMDTFEAVMRRFAAAQIRAQVRTEKKIDDFKASMCRLFSRQEKRMEAYMLKSLKVEERFIRLERRA